MEQIKSQGEIVKNLIMQEEIVKRLIMLSLIIMAK